jgi:hypothetical protein
MEDFQSDIGGKPPQPQWRRDRETEDELDPAGGRRYFPYQVRQQDRQYLHLLTIFHFVLAGLTFFFGLCPLFGIGMGVFMLSGGIPMPPPGTAPGQAPGAPQMELLGWVLIGEYSFFAIMLYGSGIVACLVGNFLRRRQRWTFCLVGSGILCLFVPLGTVLGIFTIIVLARESVRDVFQNGEPMLSDDEDYA